MRKAKFDSQKASMIFSVKIAPVVEEQKIKMQALSEQLHREGKIHQLIGFKRLDDLSFQHLKERIYIHIESDFEAITKNGRIDEKTTQELQNRTFNFINASVETLNSGVSSRLAAFNVTGGLAKEYLSILFRKSATIRGYLEKKIVLKVNEHNENSKKPFFPFFNKVITSFLDTGIKMFYKWLWTIILALIIATFIGIKSCKREAIKPSLVLISNIPCFGE